jgi:hypothetical protein
MTTRRRYTLPGAYRRLLIRPRAWQHVAVAYKGWDAPIQQPPPPPPPPPADGAVQQQTPHYYQMEVRLGPSETPMPPLIDRGG